MAVQLLMCLLMLNGSAQVHVSFMESAPEIDGIPDPEVISLSAITLDPEGKGSGSMQGSGMQADFRLAYGTSFLYIYAEIASDSLVFRDRGYQNGDGMLVVIGKPDPGRLTHPRILCAWVHRPAGRDLQLADEIRMVQKCRTPDDPAYGNKIQSPAKRTYGRHGMPDSLE